MSLIFFLSSRFFSFSKTPSRVSLVVVTPKVYTDFDNSYRGGTEEMENNKFQIHKFERLKKMKIVSVDDKLYIGQDMYTTNSGFQYDKLKGIMYQVWNDPETGEVKKDKMYDDERDLCL